MNTKNQFQYKTNTLKLSLIILATVISGCDTTTPNVLAQQQNYICKSLIDGFLRTQQLDHYQVSKVVPNLQQISPQREYHYKVGSDQNSRLNIPRQNELKFICNQSNEQHFSVALFDPAQQRLSVLMNIDLPPKNQMDALTAYSVHNK